MAGISYNVREYRNYIRMGSRKRLLVEGPNDKRLFCLLLKALQPRMVPVDVDTAEQLRSTDEVRGNREKVETVCCLVAGQPYEDKFVGFVDREYRRFSDNDGLEDLLREHLVTGRLVWSRGHSVENYLFDLQTVREPLRDFCASEEYDDALDVLESVFDPVLQVACAIGLAGRDVSNPDLVRGSLDWRQFRLRPGEIDFDVPRWKAGLIRRTGRNRHMCSRLVASFRMWHEALKRSDPVVVRWMCDGHLGLKAIWYAYAACVHLVCEQASAKNAKGYAARILSGEETIRFNCCAATWARKALGGQVEYPMEVFDMLGLGAPIGNG